MSTAYHRDNCICFYPLIPGSTLPWSKKRVAEREYGWQGKESVFLQPPWRALESFAHLPQLEMFHSFCCVRECIQI